MSLPAITSSMVGRAFTAFVIVLFVGSQIALSHLSSRISVHREAVICDVALVVAAACLIVPRAVLTRLATIPCLIVVAAVLTSTLVVVNSVEGPDYIVMTSWLANSSTFLLVNLIVRGRTVFAAICGVCVVVMTSLAVLAGLHQQGSVALLLRPAILLTLCWLFAVGLNRILRRRDALEAAETARVALAAAQVAAAAERRRYARQLEDEAGELLTLIALEVPLSEREQRECTLVEGSLRDSARAPRLVGHPLTLAVRDRRKRGATVVLLDDGQGDDLPPAEVRRIVEWMAEVLLLAEGTSFTGRILPSGRQALATVVVSGCGHHETHVYPAGAGGGGRPVAAAGAGA